MQNYGMPDYSLPPQPQGTGEAQEKKWRPLPLIALTAAYFVVMALSSFFAPWESTDLTVMKEVRPDLALGLTNPEIISFSYSAGNPVDFGLWFICYGFADFATVAGYLMANFLNTESAFELVPIAVLCLLPGFCAKVISSYGEIRWNEYPALQKLLSGMMLQNIVFYFASLFDYYVVPWLFHGFVKGLYSVPSDISNQTTALIMIPIAIVLVLFLISLVAADLYLMSVVVVFGGAIYLFRYLYSAFPMPSFVAYPLFLLLGVGAAILLEFISDFWFRLETRITGSCCGCFGALLPSRWIDSLMKKIFGKK